MSQKHEFWYEIKGNIISSEEIIEKELWTSLKIIMSTEIDSKEEQMIAIRKCGDLASSILNLRKARSLL